MNFPLDWGYVEDIFYFFVSSKTFLQVTSVQADMDQSVNWSGATWEQLILKHREVTNDKKKKKPEHLSGERCRSLSGLMRMKKKDTRSSLHWGAKEDESCNYISERSWSDSCIFYQTQAQAGLWMRPQSFVWLVVFTVTKKKKRQIHVHAHETRSHVVSMDRSCCESRLASVSCR